MINFDFIYPIESFLFPKAFLFSLFTLFVFTLIIFIKRQNLIFKKIRSFSSNTYKIDYLVNEEKGTEKEKLGIEEKLTIVTIIITIVVTGFYPFIQKPILDFSLDNDIKEDTKFTIKIVNRGLATANNVIVSINSSLYINDIQLKPLLNTSESESNCKNYECYITIPTLPPGSITDIIVSLGTSSNTNNSLWLHNIIYNILKDKSQDKNNKVTVYVRSSEAIGHHDSLIISIFYIGLSISYGLIFIYLTFLEKLGIQPPTKWKNLTERKWSIAGFIVLLLSYIILFHLVYLVFHYYNHEYIEYQLQILTTIVIFIVIATVVSVFLVKHEGFLVKHEGKNDYSIKNLVKYSTKLDELLNKRKWTTNENESKKIDKNIEKIKTDIDKEKDKKKINQEHYDLLKEMISELKSTKNNKDNDSK